MQITAYSEDHQQEWNDLIGRSKNGTFLFDRSYMDYHKDRMEDCSLLMYDKNKLCGVLPANLEGDTVCSHGGLTYGGLICEVKQTATAVMEMLTEAMQYYRKLYGAKYFHDRPVPYIYHRYPAEEELYWLYTKQARLVSRMFSSTIALRDALPFSTLRRRCVHKAQAAGLVVTMDDRDAGHWQDYWAILTNVLQERHHKRPVHSLEEINLLHERFPEEIQLVTVQKDEEVIGGMVLYLTHRVVHSQYIATDDRGRKTGALDLIVHEILSSDICRGREYFDFGVSTEDCGHYLNENLLFQKEGFGGRGVCYDGYLIDLEQ